MYCTCIATISLSSHASLVTQQCSRGQTCELSVGKEGTYARVKYRVYVMYIIQLMNSNILTKQAHL